MECPYSQDHLSILVVKMCQHRSEPLLVIVINPSFEVFGCATKGAVASSVSTHTVEESLTSPTALLRPSSLRLLIEVT